MMENLPSSTKTTGQGFCEVKNNGFVLLSKGIFYILRIIIGGIYAWWITR
jgi:hypothetical protein